MRVTRSFTVPVPASTVLDGVTDVERIAGCLPGGVIDGRRRGERFGGSFALQLGTQTAPYTAIIAAPERDDSSGRAVVTVSGHDDQGDGTAEVTATFAVREEGSASAVDLELDIELGGRLAQAPEIEQTVTTFARTSVAALRAGLSPAASPPAPTPASSDEPAAEEPPPLEVPRAEPPAAEPPAVAAAPAEPVAPPPPLRAPEPAAPEPPVPEPPAVEPLHAAEPPAPEPPAAPEPPSAPESEPLPPPTPLRPVQPPPAEEPPPLPAAAAPGAAERRATATTPASASAS